MLPINHPRTASTAQRNQALSLFKVAPDRHDVPVCRLSFSGEMTRTNCQQFEAKILKGLRCAERVELDLSAVNEIDIYGLCLLNLLQQTAGQRIVIVASSPALTRERVASALALQAD